MLDPNFVMLVALAVAVLACLFMAPPGATALAGAGDDAAPPKPERKPWEDTLMFKKGGGSAPSPDPNIGKAALMNAQLGSDWLDFAKEQFATANERQEGLDDLTKRVGEQQLATQDQANQWAREDRQRYEDVFQPIEDQYVEDATNWDSPERQAEMAAEARADVQSSAAGQRAQSERQMASMGINPNSGRFAGINRAGELGTALASAGAQNNARNQVRTQGMALRADAANMGRGLPSQAAGAAGLGLNAGNSALAGAGAANRSFINNTGIMNQGYQGAMAGNSSSANILNTQYQNQLNAWAANQQAQAAGIGGIMGAVGTGIGAFAALSSKKAKTDKQPVDGALEAIKGLPVEAWKYTDDAQKQRVPAEVIPPDDQQHVGTYAEDFARQTGLGDGKTLPLQDAIGVTMKAVQELDDKVDRLAAKGKKRATA